MRQETRPQIAIKKNVRGFISTPYVFPKKYIVLARPKCMSQIRNRKFIECQIASDLSVALACHILLILAFYYFSLILFSNDKKEQFWCLINSFESRVKITRRRLKKIWKSINKIGKRTTASGQFQIHSYYHRAWFAVLSSYYPSATAPLATWSYLLDVQCNDHRPELKGPDADNSRFPRSQDCTGTGL